MLNQSLLTFPRNGTGNCHISFPLFLNNGTLVQQKLYCQFGCVTVTLTIDSHLQLLEMFSSTDPHLCTLDKSMCAPSFNAAAISLFPHSLHPTDIDRHIFSISKTTLV
uniref:Uncharacterized protein n=1 Tax=Arion vulgaris TaxID=1028688 RepID=A0A0B7ALC3_9EUPU